MNIFLLDWDVKKCARMHVDKHVVKMILESAQMLSSAHRVLDGQMQTVRVINTKGQYRNKKVWIHPDQSFDSVLYKVAHLNHPSTVWTRATAANYEWHYRLFVALCEEYTYRYGKIHKSDSGLRSILANHPTNIPGLPSDSKTQFALAMKSQPQCVNEADPVGSYRKFYITKQERMPMVWTKRKIPSWYEVR